jgi:ribonuclease P protein component
MRLHTRQQYQRVLHKAFKFTGKWIFADIQLTTGPFSRLGIVVTKRFGDAPQRNRFKRLIREAFRLSSPHFKFFFDIVVRPRSHALHATMQDIQEELLLSLEKVMRGKTCEDLS